MHLSLSLIRFFFLGLCLLFAITYATAQSTTETYTFNLALGTISAVAFWGITIGLDYILRKFNLRSFNVIALGLFCGYLMGEAIALIFQNAVVENLSQLSPQTVDLIRLGIFLFTAYVGMAMAVRSSEELYMSIPFIRLKQNGQKKKDLLIDPSALLDPRIIDLANSGLLDHALVLPRFMVKELNDQAENFDETIRTKARRSLDVIKKLESHGTLDMRYSETDFSEIKDSMAKQLRLARLLDTNILIADPNRLQQPSLEGIRLINIYTLSTALKPFAQTGESINIKIQRYGKEPRQGIGYLEDGTMVVVNGGATFIGETIRAQVLSAKHTTSGRMIFCNAFDENMDLESSLSTSTAEAEVSAKNYFAL